MKRIYLLFLGFVFLFLNLDAQTYWVPQTPLLDSLYHWKGGISDIANTLEQPFLPIILNNQLANDKLIKNEQGLFILIAGTGRVYKATGTKGATIAFTRIDSTYYFGGNCGSYDFSYRDTLFSFGGYGFWHFNGQLRYFKEGDEWNLKKLNFEVPSGANIMNYVPQASKLFYKQSHPLNEVSDEILANGQVVELDLEKKQIRVLGQCKELLWLDEGYAVNIASLNAIMFIHQKEVYLINFMTNTVYKAKSNLYFDALNGKVNHESKNLFERNGRIYFTNTPDYSLQSIPISIKDFEKEPYPIYVPIQRKIPLYVVLICMASLLAIGFLLWQLFSLKKKLSYKGYQLLEQYNHSSNSLEFNEVEKNIVHELESRLQKGAFLSVEEINTILGLSKKSLEIQKKVRTETINRINHKFRVIFEVEDNLVERVRSEEDRRFFYYTVHAISASLFMKKYFKK